MEDSDVESEIEAVLSQRCSTKRSVCRRFIWLTNAGVIRVHGPVDNRCPGSHLRSVENNVNINKNNNNNNNNNNINVEVPFQLAFVKWH